MKLPDGREVDVESIGFAVQSEDDCVLASHPILPVWGEGATAEEALDDMCREFVARYRFLLEHEDCLGDDLANELSQFRQVLT
jgi:hypothetical protein